MGMYLFSQGARAQQDGNSVMEGGHLGSRGIDWPLEGLVTS